MPLTQSRSQLSGPYGALMEVIKNAVNLSEVGKWRALNVLAGKAGGIQPATDALIAERKA